MTSKEEREETHNKVLRLIDAGYNCVDELMAKGVSTSKIKYSLRKLRERGLVRSEKDIAVDMRRTIYVVN